ncbi:hypothetical protein PIB30_087995 [Stylosanthes scabra]|uniref:Uncharacterized protein n=1 Tax=Stylosanthes scabra TaxID=79078 RepID=A0ABU6VTQ8_9FABA|nr:hypothetical protein [Stylosanthes scabra]
MNTTNPNYGWLSRKPRSHTLSRGRVGGNNPYSVELGLRNGWALARKRGIPILAFTKLHPDAIAPSRHQGRAGARSVLTSAPTIRWQGGAFWTAQLLTFSSSRLKGAAAETVGRGRATSALFSFWLSFSYPCFSCPFLASSMLSSPLSL